MFEDRPYRIERAERITEKQKLGIDIKRFRALAYGDYLSIEVEDHKTFCRDHFLKDIFFENIDYAKTTLNTEDRNIKREWREQGWIPPSEVKVERIVIEVEEGIFALLLISKHIIMKKGYKGFNRRRYLFRGRMRGRESIYQLRKYLSKRLRKDIMIKRY